WIAYAVSGTIGRPVIRTVPHCADDWKTGEAVRAPLASTYLGRHAGPPVTFSATAARPAGGVASSQREPRAAALIEHDVCSQASVASLQLSVVQETPSPQLTGTPGWQLPPPHTSLPLQKRPSPHGSVLIAWTQPLPVLQESLVHRFPSSQLGGGPPTHAPPAQVSAVVHALPSLQAAVLLTCTQPLAARQESFVQTLPSSQLGAVPAWHEPVTHVSTPLQASLSVQSALITQVPVGGT